MEFHTCKQTLKTSRKTLEKKRGTGLSYTTHKQSERKNGERPLRSATSLANKNKQNKTRSRNKRPPVQSGLLLLYTNSEDDDSHSSTHSSSSLCRMCTADARHSKGAASREYAFRRHEVFRLRMEATGRGGRGRGWEIVWWGCGRGGRGVGEGSSGAAAMAMIVLAVIVVTAGIFVRVGKERSALCVDSLWKTVVVLKVNERRH